MIASTDIENNYDIYSRTHAGGSSMLEGVDFTVTGNNSLCIIIAIASAEGLIIFVLDISNAFQNTILPNTVEQVYLSLSHRYLEWLKKWPKHQLSSRNQK